MAKCPFCGAEKVKLDSPYINKHGEGITNYCCLAQRKNQEYIKSHTSSYDVSKPDNVDKW